MPLQMFGGAPLNKEVGDFLNSKGVDMMVLFGRFAYSPSIDSIGINANT
jgi:hypothetical protein